MHGTVLYVNPLDRWHSWDRRRDTLFLLPTQSCAILTTVVEPVLRASSRSINALRLPPFHPRYEVGENCQTPTTARIRGFQEVLTIPHQLQNAGQSGSKDCHLPQDRHLEKKEEKVKQSVCLRISLETSGNEFPHVYLLPKLQGKAILSVSRSTRCWT